MAKLSPAQLAAIGGTDTVANRRACGVFSIEGLDKAGKTHFCFTAPEPIFYQSCDFGDEGVIQKFRDRGKQIIRPTRGDYKIEVPAEMKAEPGEEGKARQKRELNLAEWAHENFYQPFRQDYIKAIEGGVRTIIWDTATEVWEWIRLSVYGRGATNRSDLQTQANAKFRELVRLANLHGVNLFMIAQLGAVWESYTDNKGDTKWAKTDRYEPKGANEKVPFLVTATLRPGYVYPKLHPTTREVLEEGYFQMEVITCRDEPRARGQIIAPNPEFMDVAAVIMPAVGVEEWVD